uniref:Cadherin domain-containing protein n=1 Tax=Anopheles dirus TaxID=7168 RepID=A0A182NBN9_9DIPT
MVSVSNGGFVPCATWSAGSQKRFRLRPIPIDGESRASEQIVSHVWSLSCGVTKFIRIGIADKNDNPPYFDKALYEAEVDENEDIQHTVLTVTAKDHDECK